MLSSCRDSVDRGFELCSTLDRMHTADQKHRLDRGAYAALYIADSLYMIDYGEKVTYVPTSYLNKAISILGDREEEEFIDPKYADSIMHEMHLLDLKLTKELMYFIDNNHSSLSDTLDCFDKALVIFVHTPVELYPIVRPFLKANQDLIPKNKYKHIMNRYAKFEKR